MFKTIIFWSEFPWQVNWDYLNKLLAKLKFNIKIYVAVKSKKEFEYIKRKIKSRYIALSVWPVLDKDKGYWFSGFTEKRDIDKLKQYKGMNIKIDLEPPLPEWTYRNHRMIFFAIKQLLRKGKNNEYLKKTIYDLTKTSKVETVVNQIQIIANEFPLARWYLERQGMYIDLKKNMTKNIMCYTSFAGNFFRPFLRIYMKYYMKKAVEKYNEGVMFSIGLIGPGILQNEKTYRSIEEFKQDLDMVKESRAKEIAIYSIEGLLKRENPEEWLILVKNYLKK